MACSLLWLSQPYHFEATATSATGERCKNLIHAAAQSDWPRACSSRRRVWLFWRWDGG